MKRGRAGMDSRVAFRSWKNSNSQKGFGDGNVKPFSGFSDNWMRRARCIAMGFRSCIERTKWDCVWKVAAGGGKEGLRTRIVREKGGRREEKVRWTSCRGGGRKLIIFRLPGVTMAFCAFDGGLGGCFLWIRVRVWVFDGRDWFDWVAVDRVVDFLFEKKRETERVDWSNGCIEKIMRWVVEMINGIWII